MSESGKSIFRNALQVPASLIAAMGEGELNRFMEMVIKAQAVKCGSPVNQIRLNTEEKAPDDGCDAWSAKPQKSDEWLGDEDTCWQFKAGTSGQPEKLRGEVLKRIPKETLLRGGRFVVVASGSTRGMPGEQDRLKVLIEDAQAAGIPVERIDVFGSDRLAGWCNQHPAVAAHWSGRSEGLWTFDDWSESDQHQFPWQQPPGVESTFEALKADLDLKLGRSYIFTFKALLVLAKPDLLWNFVAPQSGVRRLFTSAKPATFVYLN